jgi:hypothetical protein
VQSINTPKVGRGFWTALKELNIDSARIIAPVDRPFPLRDDVVVTPLQDLFADAKLNALCEPNISFEKTLERNNGKLKFAVHSRSTMPNSSPFSPEALESVLSGKSTEVLERLSDEQTFDMISFGGGSCPKVVGKDAARFGWNRICFLTNGSDNGGSTYKIVEALRSDYGPTLPVGDITSALIGLMDPFRYELLNLRSWKLDPARFTATEQQSFSKDLADKQTFFERVAIAVEHYRKKFAEESGPNSARSNFCDNLLCLSKFVDETGLIHNGVNGLNIAEASVRHHIFNAVMIHVGAYDPVRKSPNPDRFTQGLLILKYAFDTGYSVFPCSIDEQVLYAEWIDESSKVVWSTQHTLAENPQINVGGQVALSNAPDSVKTLPDGTYARYGCFGFGPDKPMPKAYPPSLNAIRKLKSGAPILFGPSSFVASISPCLAIAEIVKEIALRKDCPRILFLNLTLNNETVGWCVTDFLNFWELNTGRPVSETIDFVVVNKDLGNVATISEALKDKGDSLETFKFRGPLLLTEEERLSLPSRGVNIAEAPLAVVDRQLMRLSSAGDREFVDVPNHDTRRLMMLCRLLVDDFNDPRAGQVETKRPNKKSVALDSESKSEAVIHYASRER